MAELFFPQFSRRTRLFYIWFLRWIGVIARLIHPYNSDQTLYAKHNYRNKYRNSLVVDSLKDKE